MLQTIKKGQTNDLVKAVQYMIDTAARGTADGNFSADFEDAVMAETAKRWEADCIITRNAADYRLAALPVADRRKALGSAASEDLLIRRQ